MQLGTNSEIDVFGDVLLPLATMYRSYVIMLCFCSALLSLSLL